MTNPSDGVLEQKKGRIKLFMLIAFFVLPIVVVFAMYQLSLRPNGVSHGELLNPPRKLHLPVLNTWQRKHFSDAGLRDKWSMLYVAPAECAKPCLERVRMLRQIHASLGKEIGRVQRIVLVTGGNVAQWDTLQQEYPDLIMLAPDAQTAADLLQQIGTDQVSGGTYLIDPLANIMMRYGDTAEPVGIRKDMMRLLTYSWAG